MKTFFTGLAPTIEEQIHDEQVKYNEAFRMKAEFHVLKAILMKIKRLKAELLEQKTLVKDKETANTWSNH